MEVRTSIIEKRLKNINRVIAVASGKGGVGKSMVASNLALLLKKKGFTVGLLDLDLYGPSAHVILGVSKDVFPEEKNGIIPPDIEGISFMSIVYFSKDKPTTFRGEDITNIILEFLAITQWGSLDYLIIDLPPGIGDETLDVIRYMKKTEFLIVSTPSKVTYSAVSKLLNILSEQNRQMLGVIVNMTMNSTSDSMEKMKKQGYSYLGSIAYDTAVEDAIGYPKKLGETTFMKHLECCITQTDLL